MAGGYLPAHQWTEEPEKREDRMNDLVIYGQLPALRDNLPRVWSLGSRMFQNEIPNPVSVPGDALKGLCDLAKAASFLFNPQFPYL